MRSKWRKRCLIGFATFTSLLSVRAEAAVSFYVTNPADVLDFRPGVCTPTQQNFCSLRTALVWANTIAGWNEIVVEPGIYVLSLDGEEPEAAPRAVYRDLDITDSVTIRGTGDGAVVIDAAKIDRVFHIVKAKFVWLENLTIRGGRASVGSGGGINTFDPEKKLQLMLKNCKITGNLAQAPKPHGQGGGVHFQGDLLYLHQSEVSGNESQNSGAGINAGLSRVVVNASRILNNRLISKEGTVSGGGGIALVNGELFVADSEVSGNVATHEAPSPSTIGGGIKVEKTKLNVLNSTIAENSASGDGGGIHQLNSDLVMLNATMSANEAGGVGGGISMWHGQSIFFHDTIVDNRVPEGKDASEINNRGAHMIIGSTVIGNPDGSPGDCRMFEDFQLEGMGSNLGINNSCFVIKPTDILTPNLKLGPLTLNPGNGLTRTRALLPGSPAIDAVDSEALYVPKTDQRGWVRDASPDIGAYEFGIEEE